MPRIRDFLQKPDVIIHAFNRGAVRGQIFPDKKGYEMFMGLVVDAQQRSPVSLLAYMLLPGDFRLVLHQHEPYAVSEFLRQVCQKYSRWLNERLGRKGTNFAGRYGGIVVNGPDEFLRLVYDVHMDAVDTGHVPSVDQWPYSSHNRYLNFTAAQSDGQALLLNLVGGTGAYVRFMKKFNAADPDSVKKFLRPEYVAVWAERGAKWHHA